MKILRKINRFFKVLKYDPSIIFNKYQINLLFEREENINKQLKKTGLEEILSKFSLDKSEPYKLFLDSHKKKDILELYKTTKINCESNKRFLNILEFGCGVSTISIAYALSKQKYKGKIYACESDKKWADLTNDAITKLNLDQYCEIVHSVPNIELLNNTPVSYYDKLPNISPDLIYLDGPTTRSVEGNIRGLTMEGLKYIIAADILLYEFSLWQGAKIIIDGRFNNKKFLENSFKRKYKKYENYIDRRTVFELIE